MAFVPCPSCRRHVRDSDASCPFCAAALPTAASTAPTVPARRLGRAALFAFAAMAAGCGSSESPSTTTDSGGTTDSVATDGNGNDAEDTGMVAMYGGPPDTGTPDTGTDGGGDTKSDAPGDTNDTGGPAPAYGLPPMTDAG